MFLFSRNMKIAAYLRFFALLSAPSEALLIANLQKVVRKLVSILFHSQSLSTDIRGVVCKLSREKWYVYHIVS